MKNQKQKESVNNSEQLKHPCDRCVMIFTDKKGKQKIVKL